ncbi:MAG: helix-turn-helix transcriptional regulator [Lachnospiraceae bacterium]|nr:helix-turn-helix transcriptional regulator [Lachnospiraceae bacterium]
MKLLIGENIKRLRVTNAITQEQLAESMHVSPVAVSKWERGETTPDIALLPKLAFYFQVSIDELMSYDACSVELDIQEFLKAHGTAAEAFNLKECKALSSDAYQKYPNDYRVMELYMWDLIGGYADNDRNEVLKHTAEIDNICGRILDGCTDSFIRADAVVMRGKLLHAAGKTDEAVALYQKELPDWYQTAGQKCEQLFAKDTPEFRNRLDENICELSKFVLNKLSKKIWFCNPGTTVQEKTKEAVRLCDALKAFRPFISEEQLKSLMSYFSSDFEAKLRLAKAPQKLMNRIHALQTNC